MKWVLKLVGLACGILLFGWFLSQTDLEQVMAVFRDLGLWAPLILIPYTLVFWCDTWGWYFAFGRKGSSCLPFKRLMLIRWAGDSINHLIPSGYVGGEALKVWLIHKQGVPYAQGIASIVISKTVQSISHVAYIALAAWAFIRITPSHAEFHRAMWMVCLGSVGIMLIGFRLQTFGCFRLVFLTLDWMGWKIRRLLERKQRLLQLDTIIAHFYLKDRTSFLKSGGCYLLGWLLDTFEIYLASHLAGMPITLLQAVAVEGFIGVAKGLGFFVPGSLGVQETAILFLCRQAGISDAFAGAYALMRRGREILFALVGTTILYTLRSTWQKRSSEIPDTDNG